MSWCEPRARRTKKRQIRRLLFLFSILMIGELETVRLPRVALHSPPYFFSPFWWGGGAAPPEQAPKKKAAEEDGKEEGGCTGERE